MPIHVGSLWPLKPSFEYVHWAAARITTQAGSAATARERNAPRASTRASGRRMPAPASTRVGAEGADQRHRAGDVQEERQVPRARADGGEERGGHWPGFQIIRARMA